MKIFTTTTEMRAASRRWRVEGERVGFVPTMGFLHDGHMSLVDRARKKADRVVVSIFVNPTQFAPTEDLDEYPRDFAHDEALCRNHGVDAVFYPEVENMYAANHSTWISEDSLSVPLCGKTRPIHFRGVTTVVGKLFHIVEPDVAVFGRKDAQQALIICRMVRDLDFAIEIDIAPIVREADGLAMSSRNKYLSEDERQRALSISRSLQDAKAAFYSGERSADKLLAPIRQGIASAGGKLDYAELRSRESLSELESVDCPAVLAVAAYFGTTRLIDNIFLP